MPSQITPPPVTAAEFAALVPDANATICEVMKRFWQMAVKYAIYDAYKYEEDIAKNVVLTSDYKTYICHRVYEAGNCGALANHVPTMTPLSNTELRALIPNANDTLCLKTQPGMINWMQAVTDRVAWEESTDYLAYLCQLPCVGGSTEACPDLSITLTATPGNAKVTLAINAAGIYAGSGTWDYSIYRSETAGVFSDPVITTGTTIASAFTYEDSASVINDTTYYYKVVVSKAGCGETFEAESASVTPGECISLTSLAFGISAGPTGSNRMTLTAYAPGIGLPDGSAFKVYRSTSAGDIGAQIGSGNIGDGSADGVDSGGRRMLQFNDNFTEAVCGTSYYYTVTLQQDPACTEYTSSAGSLSGSFNMIGPAIPIYSAHQVGAGAAATFEVIAGTIKIGDSGNPAKDYSAVSFMVGKEPTDPNSAIRPAGYSPVGGAQHLNPQDLTKGRIPAAIHDFTPSNSNISFYKKPLPDGRESTVMIVTAYGYIHSVNAPCLSKSALFGVAMQIEY